ncbi:MAG: hypothetical protein R2713_12730 [Ilumatobacteraceae bacterium]
MWDAKYAELGDRFGQARAVLIARLGPIVQEAYEHLAGVVTPVELRYEPVADTRSSLRRWLAARHDDVRRGVSTVGPTATTSIGDQWHAGFAPTRRANSARWHCRCDLGAHRFVTEHTGSRAGCSSSTTCCPSLDDGRATGLLHHLPPGQVVLTRLRRSRRRPVPTRWYGSRRASSAAEDPGTGPLAGAGGGR